MHSRGRTADEAELRYLRARSDERVIMAWGKGGRLRSPGLDLCAVQTYSCDKKAAHMSKRCLLYLVLFVCIAVMGRELPEYMILGDDVSNDGDVAVYYLQPRLTVSSRADPPNPQGSSTFGKDSLSQILLPYPAYRPAAPVGHAGTELLRLIEQQRC